jgi:hypothetical protein
VKIGKWAKVLAISAVVLLMAGLSMSCGGGDDDKSSGGGDGGAKTSASSPEEYAQVVCDTIGKRYAEGEALFGDSSAFENAEDPAALQDAIAKAQPLVQGMADDLGDIEPPSEINDWHENMVTSMAGAAELFGEMKDILDKPLEEAMAEITDLQPKFDALSDPFGSLSDLPQEYQDAFDNEPKCQDLNIFS